MKKINPIDEYEEIQNFTETPISKLVKFEVKKLREENRKMKIELTAIKNVIKRYMTNGKKFCIKTD